MSWIASHADRRPILLARNRIQYAIRGWFLDQGFVEVDPACLVVSPGNELHLHALGTQIVGADLTRQQRYLHTSPEFAMKKLLAAGEEKVFAFSHVWRGRERGPRHATEFVMLEWYRAAEPYTQLMTDCAAILRCAAEAAGVDEFRHGDRACDPRAPLEKVTVAEAFAAEGIDLLATLAPPDQAGLALALKDAGIGAAPDDGWSDLFSKALTERVEPALGPAATVLDEYPAPEAALARRSARDPRVAERFELFACGVELANGFGELTDPVEQRARFEEDMAERERIYGERYPMDEEFLAALADMPDASGIALGFDRLVMLATHAPGVREVMWVPPA